MSNKVPVNSLVDLLFQYRPENIEKLKEKYTLSKTQENILKPGRMLGDKTEADVYLYLDVAEEGLTLAKNRIHPNMQQLKSRLGKAKKLRLFGEIVAAISSVGLISALLVNESNVAIITAFINFFAVI